MRKGSGLLLCCCVLVSTAACDGVEATSPITMSGAVRTALDQSVVDGCLACHRGALSLEDETNEDVAAAIARIIAGELDHVAPIPDLSDEDRQALARALVGADG
jgi:hypothetical protein